MRLKVKNKAIYGTFMGYVDQDKKKVAFLDEELNEIIIYPKAKLEPTYEKI